MFTARHPAAHDDWTAKGVTGMQNWKRVVALAAISMALGSCGQGRNNAGVVLEDGRDKYAVAELRPNAGSDCQSIPVDGSRVNDPKVFTHSARLRSPGDAVATLRAGDAIQRTRQIGHYAAGESTALCTQVLLGLYDDTVAGPMGRLAWAVVYHQFGRMAGGRGGEDVAYEQATVVDALTGEFITSIEYPLDQSLPPPPCRNRSNPGCTNPGGVGPVR